MKTPCVGCARARLQPLIELPQTAGARVLAGLLVLLLGACGGLSADDFAGSEPRFVPEEALLGEWRVYGLVLDRFGEPRRQFRADVTGRMEGDVLVLDESFLYRDGETDERVWRIRKVGEGRYEGEADDVVGTAIGTVSGQALNFRYDIDLEVGDDTWRVHFDDWLLLQPEGVIVNRAEITRYGVQVGQMLAFFEPVGERAGASP
ncbi:MAG: DUF3833 domain-containing protein [Geminicoccaceae bacterium]|nr:DUF3833 domain-containing protein [Geminicoccaceae bacterium]